MTTGGGILAEGTELTAEEYELIRRLVYEHSGINLGPHKQQLVKARLGRFLREGNFRSYREYCQHVAGDSTGRRISELIDAISTNTTHLFREMRHFELLRRLIGPWCERAGTRPATLRIWSAACSSGEEPHSIAMVACHELARYPRVQLKILATDISTRMLARARAGMYEPHRVGTVPPELASKYLQKIVVEGRVWLQIAPAIREVITFSRFNLMQPTFPFRHGFDFVFCRNVMIYFDRPTQEALVQRIARHLHPGGYLMIGHSESLNGIRHPLTYVEPTVYRKD